MVRFIIGIQGGGLFSNCVLGEDLICCRLKKGNTPPLLVTSQRSIKYSCRYDRIREKVFYPQKTVILKVKKRAGV